MSDNLFGDDRDDFFAEDGDFGEGAFDDFEDIEDLGDFDLGDEAELPDFDEEIDFGEERSTIFGLNRNFVLIGGVIAIILCVGIAAVTFVILGNQGPSDIDLTVTSVYATNTYVAFALDETATQNALYADMTSTAAAWTKTPTPTATFTASPEPTEAQPTQTQAMVFVTPTPDGQGGGISADAVAQTATALAQILAGGTPTPEVIDTGTGFVTATPVTSLPSTGLFDDIGAGGGMNSLATAGLAVVGLAALIFVSRRLRSR